MQESIQLVIDSLPFLLKGAVGTVARRLEVSEPTVYRYLRG